MKFRGFYVLICHFDWRNIAGLCVIYGHLARNTKVHLLKTTNQIQNKVCPPTDWESIWLILVIFLSSLQLQQILICRSFFSWEHACIDVCECQPLLTGRSAPSDHIGSSPPFLFSLRLQLHIWVFLSLTCADRRAVLSEQASPHGSTHTHTHI